MNYLWVVLPAAIGLTASATAAVVTKRNKSKNMAKLSSENGANELSNIEEASNFMIKVESLPLASVDEKSLVEIKDKTALAKITNTFPGLVKAGAAANCIAKNAKESGEVLYRVVIPAGEKLVKSSSKNGAFRAMFMGKNGIKGHADLMAVDPQGCVGKVANITNAAMGVASMVVGQYYMNQINNQLGEIHDDIAQIQDFQKNEFGGRVFALISGVKNIIGYQTEILSNQETRLTKINQLEDLQRECAQLLGQSNLSLNSLIKKENLDYDEYEKTLKNTNDWFVFQKALSGVFSKISDLTYTLKLGTASREQCQGMLRDYQKQTEETQARLVEWNENNTKRLGIELNKQRRKRSGVNKVLFLVPGLIKNDYKYRPIDNEVLEIIKSETSSNKNVYEADTTELYGKDVQIVSKDGKMYYLLDNKENKKNKK